MIFRYVVFCIALMLFAPAAFAATSTVTGGTLALTIDDSGGAGGGWASMTLAGGANLLGGGYFSIAEPAFPYVNDGRHSIDWDVITAIAAGPVVDSYSTTVCEFQDTVPGNDSELVEQFTFADPASVEDYVIVVFRVTNTWTGGALPALYPTLWLDLDAEATEFVGNTAGVADFAYHFGTGGGPEIGIAVLSGGISNVSWQTAFPANDTAELALVAAANPFPAPPGAAADYFTGITCTEQDIPAIDDSFYVAFAIVAGADLTEAENAATAAQTAWTNTILPAITAGFPDSTGAVTVTSVTPSSGAAAGGTTVTIVGTGFTGATSVTFGGVAGTNLAVASDTQLTVVTPAGSGDATVVVNVAGDSGSLAAGFDYTAAPAFPVGGGGACALRPVAIGIWALLSMGAAATLVLAFSRRRSSVAPPA